MGDDLCSGWGIRTLSDRMPHFNPMSYHNGSIWPHDNSLIVLGLRRMGFVEEAAEVAWQVYQAAYRFRYFRLPELYCGFARDLRYHSVPATYPSACSPQAWAAGTSVLMLQALLGLEADAFEGVLRYRRSLPQWLDGVRVGGLRVGQAVFDLKVHRAGEGVSVEVLPKAGVVELVPED
jgi:glycogen debranching enzyme